MNIINIRNKIVKHYKEKDETYREAQQKHNRKWLKYYGDKRWKKLREEYFNEHPVCEICEMNGIYKQTDDIHHLHVFGNAPTEEAKYSLLLNKNNLCSCCKMHHNMFHEYLKRNYTDYASKEELFKYEIKMHDFE